MLRTLFVTIIFLVGVYYAVQGPFNALLLYLWIAYFRPQEWVWGGWITNAPVSLLVALLVVGYTLVVHRRYSLGPVQLFMVLFLIWGVISTANSLDPGYSEAWIEAFAKTVLMAYLISVLLSDMEKFRIATVVLVLSAGAEPAKEGLINTITNPGAGNYNLTPHLGDNNGVALAMLMLFCLVVPLFKTARHRWEKYLYLVFGAGLILRALNSYSRGGFVTLAVLMVLYWIQERGKFRNLLIAGALVMLVVSIMPDRYFERMNTIVSPIEGDQPMESSAASRLHLWQMALLMANDRPLLGVGFNAYKHVYPDYDTSNGEYGEVKSAHGSFPGVLADTGYVGLFFYTGVILSALLVTRRTMRLSRLHEDGDRFRHFARGVRNAVIAFLVGGTFLSYMYIELVWHMFGLAAALGILSRNAMAGAQRARARGPAIAGREVVGK
jgi:probable O-glycosylation ligase (exosortase A-associated)